MAFGAGESACLAPGLFLLPASLTLALGAGLDASSLLAVLIPPGCCLATGPLEPSPPSEVTGAGVF